MTERIDMIFQTEWIQVKRIFDDPLISKFFNNGLNETEELARQMIIEFKNNLIKSQSIDSKESLIPTDDNEIYFQFIKNLKIEIVSTAISQIFIEKSLNIEKNILKLCDPVNMIQLFSDALDRTFENMMVREMIEASISERDNQYLS